MKELYFGDNPIGDVGAIALSRCISKINVLNLSGCKITDQGMKALTQEIEKKNHSVGFLLLTVRLKNRGRRSGTCSTFDFSGIAIALYAQQLSTAQKRF